MNPLSKRERMRRALWRQPVDRLPVQTNYTPVMGRKLRGHFKVPADELPNRLDNHLLRLDLTFPKRLSADGKVSYDWWGAGWDTETEGYWHSHAPLANSRLGRGSRGRIPRPPSVGRRRQSRSPTTRALILPRPTSACASLSGSGRCGVLTRRLWIWWMTAPG